MGPPVAVSSLIFSAFHCSDDEDGVDIVTALAKLVPRPTPFLFFGLRSV